MKVIKNNAKKLVLLGTLAVTTFCGIAHGEITDISQINAENITQITVDEFSQIVNKANTNNPITESGIKKLTSYITQNNFLRINPMIISYLLQIDIKSFPIAFASYITKDNFLQVDVTIINATLRSNSAFIPTFETFITEDNIQKIDPDIIKNLLKWGEGSKRTANLVVQKGITKDNFKHYFSKYEKFIDLFLKADVTLAPALAQYITKDNLAETGDLVQSFIQHDQTLTPYFIDLITEDNFLKINPWTIIRLIEKDTNCAKKITSYITEDNFLKISMHIIAAIVTHMPSAQQQFIAYVTENNFTKIVKTDPQKLVAIIHGYSGTGGASNSEVSPLFLKWGTFINKNNFTDVPAEVISKIVADDPSQLTSFISCIDQANFRLVYPEVIYTILNEKPDLLKTFTDYISQDNIHVIHPYTLRYLILEDPSLCALFVGYINEKNFSKLYPQTISMFLNQQSSLIKTFCACINKNNIHLVKPFVIYELLEQPVKDSGDTSPSKAAQYLASCITPDNIYKLPEDTPRYLINHNKACREKFISYITQENIHKIQFKPLMPLLEGSAPSQVLKKLSGYITKDNIIRSWHLAQILKHDDKELEKNIPLWINKKLPELDREYLEAYIVSPQTLENYHDIQRTFDGTRVTSTMPSKNKSFSTQHFATNYPKINELFSVHLNNDPKTKGALLAALEKEWSEQSKGNYTLAHGRNSSRFVNDQVFMHLLELHLKQPIDKTSWYPLHWRKPGENYPYEKVAEIIQKGRHDTDNEQRNCMQFFSDLLGTKHGSSALDYVFDNDNAGGTSRNAMTVEKLFELFGWGKYYQFGAQAFKKAEKLQEKMQYGTLLIYSFTPKALEEFVFATHKSGAGKGDITLNNTPTSAIKTNSPKVVLDTLKNSPDFFHFKEKKYEYVMMICDDHPTDKTKLGTQNPFNQEMRTYHFNLGDDKKLADKIKHEVAAGFMAIKFEMIKDGVIQGPPKSRL